MNKLYNSMHITIVTTVCGEVIAKVDVQPKFNNMQKIHQNNKVIHFYYILYTYFVGYAHFMYTEVR